MRIRLNMFFILFLFLCYYTGYLYQAIAIFVCVLFHEMGHVYMARFFKIKVMEIELFPFGGIARMEDITKYGGFIETAIALAGPAVSMLLMMLFSVLSIFAGFFSDYMQYNLVLFLFNMIPVLPMDGGRIVRNLLMKLYSYKKATKIVAIMGKLFAVILVLYNIYIIISGAKSIVYTIAAAFIYIGAEKEIRNGSYYYLLNRNSNKIQQIKKRKIRKRTIRVTADTPIKFAAEQFSPSNLCEIIVVNDAGEIMKILSEADIMTGLINFGYDGIIKQLI